MITLPNFLILDQIDESSDTLIYRGMRQSDHLPVILKVLKEDYPTSTQLSQYQQEYTLLNRFNSEGIIKVYSLEKYQNTCVLVLEDFGGESLKKILSKSCLSLVEILGIGVKITEVLSEIHSANIIHKDINPSNIIYNVNTEELKIIDFGISKELTRENHYLNNLTSLEGTLPYISPEQTGRMNRSLDYRTDFYSLGITLYELLTKQLPFPTEEVLELIHCHLAKIPVPPHEINPEIPPIISQLIMKLLEKAPEDRYQHAWGIESDLICCLMQLQANGEVETFPLAENDICDKFYISPKLYGREKEIETILNTFENVLSNRGKEMILITGYSGIGKSKVLQEITHIFTHKKNYWMMGQCQETQQNIPYSSLIQALDEILQQILTESEQKLNQWREKILNVMGNGGQSLINIIPKLELIIGDQNPVNSQLNVTEYQNYLQILLQKLIKLFCQQEYPLILCLDDLQWADSATLELIKVIMIHPEITNFLWIGSYRDDEFMPENAFMSLLAELQKEDMIIHHISLEILSLNDIIKLLADTLKNEEKKVIPLAQLVLEKTGGSPYFVHEFLHSIYREEFLRFNLLRLDWEWDLEQIKLMSITDNIIELMIHRLKKLSDSTQEIIGIAACIGKKFNLSTLTAITSLSPEVISTELLILVQMGLILVHVQFDYEFLHHRIYQTAYDLVEEQKKAEIHLKMGYLLLNNTTPDNLNDKIFEIVDHLNRGSQLISNLAQKEELGQLNLIAAKKAKSVIAYNQAFKYLKMSRYFLEQNQRKGLSENSLQLYQELLELAYLCGEFQEAEEIAEILKTSPENRLGLMKLYEVKMQTLIAEGKLLDAVNLGKEGLEKSQISLSSSPREIQQKLREIQENLEGKVGELIDLPLMVDIQKLGVMRLLSQMVSPSYRIDFPLFIALVTEQVNLSIHYGSSPLSPLAYVYYGIVLIETTQDFEEAYQFSILALNLLKKYNLVEQRSKTLGLFGSLIYPTKNHLKDSLLLLEEAEHTGQENGQLEEASYAIINSDQFRYWLGEELFQLEKIFAKNSKILSQFKQDISLKWHSIFHQAILNLLGQSFSYNDLIGEVYNEEESLRFHQETDDYTGLFYLYLNKAILSYLFARKESAFKYSQKAEEYFGSIRVSFAEQIFYFYDALIWLEYCSQFPSRLEECLLKVTKNQEKIQNRLLYSAMNLQHKNYLIEAEKARILGNYLAAMEHYDQAINDAKVNGYIQEEALGNERAALFYLGIGKEKIARIYMMEAHFCYRCWGAQAKVNYLEKHYSHLLTLQSLPSSLSINPKIMTSSSTGNSSQSLDLEAIMKASECITGEIELDKLLASLMKILIQNAGAQLGYLILYSGSSQSSSSDTDKNKLLIEAEGSIYSEQVTVLQSTSLKNLVPLSIINYVNHTQESIVLDDSSLGKFSNDPYLKKHSPKSILCTPLSNQGELKGMVYLENNLTNAFTSERIEIIKLLSGQAAIAITNAKLYTELKRSEKNLRESESRLLQLLEAMPIGVGILNNRGNPYYMNRLGQELLGQGLVVDANSQEIPQIYQLYIAGTNEIYPPENLPIVRALKGEVSVVDDIEIHHPDKIIPIEGCGTPVYDEEGKIAYVISAFQDISERKKAEKFLAEYNRTLEQQVKERTQELSQALNELKAAQDELVQSEKMAALGQLIAGIAHEINTPLGAIRSSAGNITRCLHQTLEEFPTLCQSLNAEETREFLTLLQKSITANSHLSAKEERKLKRQLTRELEEENFAEADTIADTLVDMGIYTNLQEIFPLLKHPESLSILDMSYKLSALHRGAQTISTATDRASKVVFALKSYARYDTSGAMIQANLIEGIETILTLYHNQIKHGVELIKNYGELPKIFCYPDELNQVWTNLIHNALQAMDNQGILVIQTVYLEEEQQVKVLITDNGKGIPPEILPKIFEPFFTTKPAGEGSGLGLHIIRKIIDKHSGKITVESQPGSTTFTVLLPIPKHQENSYV